MEMIEKIKIGHKNHFPAILNISLLFIFSIYSCASTNYNKQIGPKMRIAVVRFDVKTDTFKVKDIDEKLIDMFSTALFKSGNYDLVERDRIEKVFKEQEFQLSGLVDAATAVEIGRILGAQAIVTGTVTYIDFTFMNMAIGLLAYCTSKIDARIISTETGKLIEAVSETGRSYAWGIPVQVTAQGKTRDDLLGLKRTNEDMIDSALRNAVKKAVSAINKQLYEITF